MSDPTQYEWFYSTIQGAQAGPVSAQELKHEFSVQNTTADCLAWNDSMANWTVIADLPDLMSYLVDQTPRQSFQHNQQQNQQQDQSYQTTMQRQQQYQATLQQFQQQQQGNTIQQQSQFNQNNTIHL
jgi:hypothetical protein